MKSSQVRSSEVTSVSKVSNNRDQITFHAVGVGVGV